MCSSDLTVWVHDYQLQLVPRMLRERRPDLRIGFFLHIPFPPSELFAQLPWRTEIVEGMLGADLVGFHTPGGAANFLRLTERLLGLSPDGTGVSVPDVSRGDSGRRVEIGAFPISVDAKEYDELARRPDIVEQAAELRHRLGDPKHVLLGVDRARDVSGNGVGIDIEESLLAKGDWGDDGQVASGDERACGRWIDGDDLADKAEVGFGDPRRTYPPAVCARDADRGSARVEVEHVRRDASAGLLRLGSAGAERGARCRQHGAGSDEFHASDGLAVHGSSPGFVKGGWTFR